MFDHDFFADQWRQCGLKIRGVWTTNDQAPDVHRHPDHWQLIILHAGRGTYTSGTQHMQLRAGDVALFRPGDATKVSSRERIDATIVLFSPLVILGERSALDYLTLPFQTPYATATKVGDLAACCHGTTWDSPHDAMRARFIIDPLLYEIICLALKRGDTQLTTSAPQWLHDVVAEVRRRCGEAQFTAADMVNLSGYSHGYFCRQLQHYFQQSPGDLLRHLRVDRLRHIMQADPTVSVAYLVEQCGFGNIRKMHRQVRAETGMDIRSLRG